MKISALVSAYYAEKFLDGRLINLTSQNADIEIIVICRRGSKEHRIAESYPVKLILTDDTPPLYEAWNMGIIQAQGKYLVSANCDDLFYSGSLQAMANHLDKCNCALVTGNTDLRTGDNIREWIRHTNPPVNLKFNSVGSMPMWRKSNHLKYGYFDESMLVAGDYEFWVRLLANGERICHIDKTIGLYWRRDDSIEHRHSDVSWEEKRILRERYRYASRTEPQQVCYG